MLKNLGLSAAGASIIGTTPAAATHEQLDVWLYPNEESDRDKTKNEIWDAILHFLNQLADNNVIPAFGLSIYSENTGLNYNSSECKGSTYWGNFKDWIDNNRSNVNNVHLGVTGHTNFANAAGFAKGESGWNHGTPGKAFVGTAGGYGNTAEDTKRYQNLAIQEVAHEVISTDYSFVNDMIEGDEHDLGKLNGYWDGDEYKGVSTPLLTFYENGPNPCGEGSDRSSKGDCLSGSFVTWDGTHDLDVTQCTMDAIEYTKDQEAG